MTRKNKALLAVLLLAGGCIRLWIAFQPIEQLSYKVIPDDAFYYFQTARHIIAGNGSTLDGLERHNGYHPAWMAMILPIFSALSGDPLKEGAVSAVRWVLVLGALLDVLTAFLLFHLARRLTGSVVLGTLATAFHLFDPYAVFQSTDGLETSLLGLAITAVLVISRESLSGTVMNTRRAVATGVLLGLLMLTRTDAVLFAGPLLLVMLFTSADRKETFKKVIVSGAVASLMVLPWIIWGRLYVGLWGQTSASAGPYELHLAFMRGSGPLSGYPYWKAVGNSILLGCRIALELSPLGYLIIPSFIGVVLVALIRREKTGALKFFIAPAVYCLLLLAVHSGWRWMPRNWYYAPLYIFLELLIPVVIGSLIVKYGPGKKIVLWVAGIAFVFVSGVTGYDTWKVGLWPGQEPGVKWSRKVRRNLPPGVKVGSTDGGIFSYFGPPGVVNLDGVVNEPARRAIRDGRLLDYCLENEIKLVGMRPGFLIPEIMGKRFRLHLYPGPFGFLEVRADRWGQPERFAVPNGVIDMGGKEAERYLLSGWSISESNVTPSMVWAISDRAEMAVTVPGGAKCIEIVAQPFHHTGSKLHGMEVSLDDKALASYELIPGWQEIKISIPEEKANDRIHILGFRFDPPPYLTPLKLGLWVDNRTLAVAIDKIRFVSSRCGE